MQYKIKTIPLQHNRNIKEELESVFEKQYLRVERTVKQIFDIDDSEDMMQFIESLYKEEWEAKSKKAFDYTTNNVLDLVSRSYEMEEKAFVLELAKVVTGFELSYWTDNKINDFEEALNNSVGRLREYDPKDALKEGELKITIESANGTPMVTQFSPEELSVSGQTLLNKMKNAIGDFGDSIGYEEKISILTEIMKDIIG